MKFSKKSVDALIDLVEIKLSAMEVTDREDARERAKLEAARDELKALQSAFAAQRVRRPPLLPPQAIAPQPPLEPAHAALA
jgi:hypothetical protein